MASEITVPKSGLQHYLKWLFDTRILDSVCMYVCYLFLIVVSRWHCRKKHHLKWKHDVKKIADRIVEVLKDYLFIFISSLFKVDLRLVYKKPINKLPSNNDNDKTEYLIVTKNQHVANRLYITYMGNQASTFLFFV